MKFAPTTIALTSVFFPLTVTAQITTDGTTSTTVTPIDTGVQIDNGNRNGENLFHSFGEFSIPTEQEAFFNNASDIANIFSRVTGGNISNIDGLVRANGTANLFLINPAGIVFGENARLQLGGSFYGSTANSIVFDNGEFSATDLDNPPLITVNAPMGLNFRDEPGKIVNNSQAIEPESQSLVGLQVQSGATLALIGGELNFNGGILTAPGGNIELGSVADSSLVNLRETARGFIPEYGAVQNFGNIQLNQQAVINASGFGGGTIKVQGKQLSIQDGSQIVSITQGDLPGGTISIETSELVEVKGISSEGTIPSSIQNHTQGAGDSGDLIIHTGELKISDGALIFAATFAQGMGGDIRITTFEGTEILGSGFNQYQETFIRGILLGTTRSTEGVNGISVGTFGTGNSGNVVLETPSLHMSNGASIFSPTFASGMGGDIQINTSQSLEIIGAALQSGAALNSTGAAGDIIVDGKELKIGDGGIIVSATLGSASGGNIIINASDSLELFNTPPEALIPGGILANSSQNVGKAGDIQIKTNNLSITEGAVINNNSGAIIPNPTLLEGFLRLSGGFGGNITINAANIVNLTGISPNGVTSSGIGTTALGVTSPAGGIDIKTKNLIIQDGARIDAATIGGGDGGKIVIEATESITVSGQSQLGEAALVEGFVSSAISATSGRIDIPLETTGKAGDLSIKTGKLTIQDTAEIGINSISLGEAGNLEIIANSIVLDNQGTISAATSSGQGGNIFLQIDRALRLREESLISAQAESNANGGNIEIDTEFIIAYPSGGQGNDILASAEQGKGGNISITAESLLNIQERKASPNNGTNEIDASSGVEGLDGTVAINTPDVNSLRETTELSDNVVSAEIIAASNACATSDRDRVSGLVVKGKGGIPQKPTKPFTADDLIDSNESTAENITNPDYTSSLIQPVAYKDNGEPVYLARGVIKQADGSIILTAYPTDRTTHRTLNNSYGCN